MRGAQIAQWIVIVGAAVGVFFFAAGRSERIERIRANDTNSEPITNEEVYSMPDWDYAVYRYVGGSATDDAYYLAAKDNSSVPLSGPSGIPRTYNSIEEAKAALDSMYESPSESQDEIVYTGEGGSTSIGFSNNQDVVVEATGLEETMDFDLAVQDVPDVSERAQGAIRYNDPFAREYM